MEKKLIEMSSEGERFQGDSLCSFQQVNVVPQMTRAVSKIRVSSQKYEETQKETVTEAKLCKGWGAWRRDGGESGIWEFSD